MFRERAPPEDLSGRTWVDYDNELPASPGWEKVADHALDWALEHAAQPSMR